MPGAVRLSDTCTGHSCWPSRPNTSASNDVFTNDRGSHRQGDSWAVHACIIPHGGSLASGSPNVFVNDKQAGRIGDSISCGSSCASGSSDVIIN